MNVRLRGTPTRSRSTSAIRASASRPTCLPQIFEPFFSTKEAENGVGLGLAVVYGIVQRHGGQIDVESKVGQRHVFHLRLPRQPPEQVDGNMMQNRGTDDKWGGPTSNEFLPNVNTASRHLARRTDTDAPPPARILIVDDEFSVRDSLYQWFRKDGYEVKAAENATEACGPCRHRYEVVLLDIKMPGMDGMDCSEHIHRIDPRPP